MIAVFGGVKGGWRDEQRVFIYVWIDLNNTHFADVDSTPDTPVRLPKSVRRASKTSIVVFTILVQSAVHSHIAYMKSGKSKSKSNHLCTKTRQARRSGRCICSTSYSCLSCCPVIPTL
jgi:hypothetical protein